MSRPWHPITDYETDPAQLADRESVEDVQSRFGDWLERVIERGLALWESAL